MFTQASFIAFIFIYTDALLNFLLCPCFVIMQRILLPAMMLFQESFAAALEAWVREDATEYEACPG